MDNNTHGEFIVGNGFSVFVDGVPDKCEHVWDGDHYYVSKSGRVIYWHTYRQWAHLTTQAREPLIMEYHNSIEDPILESGVSCSKCKKLYSPPMF